ncbi:DUF2972 domain-containing protein [Campylobacter armoricus]|uniref:DUF2972 domain-containing protein n=1 Tax=Campylobacter armoricus TaxID=2505970 RepID=UPI00111784AF|nr:DUF2972 domain-containing protein [Campylobacter armoricus]
MFDPYSAIDRIKNQLAYRLGSAIIEHNANGGGYLSLIYKLYKIKKEYTKEQKLYKQTIKLFPQLKYPKVEICKDYNESIKYKYHLSYMLGQTLIQAHKNKFKGVYFKLYKNKQNIKIKYNLLKELGLNEIDISPKNKELLVSDFSVIKDILQIHKNYKPILENIFRNFDYTLKHLDLIKEWLLSDDFYQKYKKDNHPYPSLLDPEKLKKDTEKLNYNNISPELAWEMNLPLPNNYKLVWLYKSCSGSMAMYNFFTQCEIGCQAYAWEDGKKMYIDMCNYIGSFKTSIAVAPTITQNNYHGKRFMMYKLFHLFSNINTVMFIMRDPFSIFKHAINHIDNVYVYQYNIKPSMKKYKLSVNLFIFPKMYYSYSNSERPNISISFEKIFINSEFYFTTQKRLNILNKYNKIENIECLEMADINKENAFNTFTRLAKKYGFTPPSNPIPFQGRVNRNQGDLIYLPVTLYAHPYDLTNPKAEDDTSFGLEGGVNIIITTHQIHPKKEGFVDITYEIFNSRELMFDNIVLLVKSNEYEILKNNQELFLASKKYLNEYMNALEEHEQKIKDNLITEEQILDYLKDKKDLRIKLKSILDEDLTYVRENHPEYLQKWKYYQEFEKLCEND